MDASADFPMNGDEPARNVIEIPSSDRATALEFAIDRLQHALRDPTCSLVEFTTADADINLHDLWDDMKERLKRQPWASEVHLSRVSKSFLYVTREGERHRKLKARVAMALTMAVAGPDLDIIVEGAFDMEAVGTNGAAEKLAPDVSLCCNDEPVVWIEISDSQRYREVVEKMMLVSASRLNVKKFVVVHLYPTGTLGDLANSDREFSMDFQVFDRLEVMRQLGTGRFCTLNFRPPVRRDPAADHLPQNEVPQPENRMLMQRFDLVLTSLRVFQFTNVETNPIYRIFGDDNILRLQFSAILQGSHRSRLITLAIDMSTVLEALQQYRDAYAARAAEALGNEPQARFNEKRVNKTIEQSLVNVRLVSPHIYHVLEHRVFEGRRGRQVTEGTPLLDIELLGRLPQ